jgi:hypothetical protein
VTVINDCSDLKDALSTTTEAGSSAASAISGSGSSSEAEKSLLALVDAYFALSVDKDLPFLRWVITTKNLDTKTNIENVVKTLSHSSFLAGFPLTSTGEYLVEVQANNANAAARKISYLVMIGLVYWYCHECQPTAAKRFHLYLQQLYESATEDQTEFVESALLNWEVLSYPQFKKYLPSSYKRDKIDLTLVETDKEEEEKEKQYKESKVRCKQLLELVKSEEEEEDEEEED